MGYNPQESLENTINTMGTLLGVHPIVPWKKRFSTPEIYKTPKKEYTKLNLLKQDVLKHQRTNIHQLVHQKKKPVSKKTAASCKVGPYKL